MKSVLINDVNFEFLMNHNVEHKSFYYENLAMKDKYEKLNKNFIFNTTTLNFLFNQPKSFHSNQSFSLFSLKFNFIKPRFQ